MLANKHVHFAHFFVLFCCCGGCRPCALGAAYAVYYYAGSSVSWHLSLQLLVERVVTVGCPDLLPEAGVVVLVSCLVPEAGMVVTVGCLLPEASESAVCADFSTFSLLDSAGWLDEWVGTAPLEGSPLVDASRVLTVVGDVANADVPGLEVQGV